MEREATSVQLERVQAEVSALKKQVAQSAEDLASATQAKDALTSDAKAKDAEIERLRAECNYIQFLYHALSTKFSSKHPNSSLFRGMKSDEGGGGAATESWGVGCNSVHR